MFRQFVRSGVGQGGVGTPGLSVRDNDWHCSLNKKMGVDADGSHSKALRLFIHHATHSRREASVVQTVRCGNQWHPSFYKMAQTSIGGRSS